VQGLDQNIEIALIQPPAGIADIEALDGTDLYSFDRAAPSASDHAEEG
jgi:hypothetical protein